MVAKLNMQCPEVNGFLASIEERLQSRELTPRQSVEEVAQYTKEHVPECPTCSGRPRAKKSGIEGETIHWSDWGSQPEIRIACSQGYHLPWRKRKDLPEGVHEVPVKELPSILYTFNTRLVTCEACKALESFEHNHDRALDFDRRLAESGLTEEEYVERLRAEMLEKLEKR